jgi:hypothetical protein
MVPIAVHPFSSGLWLAVLLTRTGGTETGNSGVVKTYVGEVTDSTNQARAFAFISLAYNAGAFGTLSFEIYSLVRTSCTYVICVCVCVCVCVCLHEQSVR